MMKGRYKKFIIIRFKKYKPMKKENIKQEEYIKQLEHLELPEIETPAHKRQLRIALLSAPRFTQSRARRFWNAIGNASSMNMKKIIPIGAIALVAVVALVAGVGFQGMTPRADAQQVTRLSLAMVSGLPAEDSSALTAILNADPATILKEAQNASDLTTLTYDQFIALYPQGVTQANPAGVSASVAFAGKLASSTLIAGTATPITTPAVLQVMANMKAQIEAEQAALKTAKFLQFTDPQGEKVVIAVGSDNMPISINITLANGLRVGQQSF
jgi:hypothetical protein